MKKVKTIIFFTICLIAITCTSFELKGSVFSDYVTYLDNLESPTISHSVRSQLPDIFEKEQLNFNIVPPDTCVFILCHDETSVIYVDCIYDNFSRMISWINWEYSGTYVFKENAEYSEPGSHILREWDLDYINYLIKVNPVYTESYRKVLVTRALIMPDTTYFDSFEVWGDTPWPRDSIDEVRFRNDYALFKERLAVYIKEREKMEKAESESVFSKIIDFFKHLFEIISSWFK